MTKVDWTSSLTRLIFTCFVWRRPLVAIVSIKAAEEDVWADGWVEQTQDFNYFFDEEF